MMSAYCPSILFPYARDVISGYASRGSFPQHILAPVNFDSLYAKKMQEKSENQH